MRNALIFERAGRPLVGAHRGASAEAPENTTAAFDLAVAQGAELIECDVHRTADGRLVIHHDFQLKRTGGNPAFIRDLSFTAVRAFDVGAWKDSRFSGQRIPTLDEVLHGYGHSVFLNVEIKVDRSPSVGIEDDVARALIAHALVDRVVLSTFDLETFLRLRRLHPEIRTSLLYEAPATDQQRPGISADDCLMTAITVSALFGAAGIHLEHGLITKSIADRAHQAGLGVLAWTVDDEAEMARLADLGVDAILSNRPAALRAAVQPWRQWPA